MNPARLTKRKQAMQCICSQFLSVNYYISIVRPRTHQQQCRSNIRLCCHKRQQCRKILLKISSFRQCRMLLQHCCRYWRQCCWFRQQCRTKFRPFDKVKTNWTCSICFDIVERTKFRSTNRRNRQHCCRKRQHCCQKRQQCRSNIRHCRKNRLTCIVRQCCFDIVASMDGA